MEGRKRKTKKSWNCKAVISALGLNTVDYGVSCGAFGQDLKGPPPLPKTIFNDGSTVPLSRTYLFAGVHCCFKATHASQPLSHTRCSCSVFLSSCLHASCTWVQGRGGKNMLNRPAAVRIWGNVRGLSPRRAKSSQQSIYRVLSFLP